jgi:hypothetical protein
MTRFEYINENIERIKFDVKIGLIPCSLLRHFAIYSRVDYYKKLGNKHSDAIICTENDYQISERQICRIMKDMEAPV